MTPAELERRVLALERQLAGRGAGGSPGLSTAFGAGSTVYRDRFPVELTSSFDTLTGYDWDRLVLVRGSSATSVDEAAIPQTGSYAFTPDNNESLTSGTRGWLEADPNAGGWFFLLSAAGVAAGDCGHLNPGFATTDCLHVSVVSVSGLCSTVDADQIVPLAWDGVDSRWESTFDFLTTGSGSPGGAVNFGFGATTGVPYLTIDGVYGTPFGCEDGGFLFAFGGAVLCAGGTLAACANYLVVKVECGCCPATGFTGVGWYCVVANPDTCVSGPKVCVNYTASVPCTGVVTICDGPFASQAACLAGCAGVSTGGDSITCGRTLAATLVVTLSGGNGTMNLTWDAVDLRYEGSKVLLCGETIYLRYDPTQDAANPLTFSCDNVTFGIAFKTGAPSCGPPYTAGFAVDLDGTDGGGCPVIGGCIFVAMDISE